MDIRYDNESRQSLEKANFEMKMKIYYLEEEMRKLRRAAVSGHDMNDVDNMVAEIESMRLLLQEKTLELEQRKCVLAMLVDVIFAIAICLLKLKRQSSF